MAAKNNAFFISIDGLRADHLSGLLQRGYLNAERGFRWLIKHSAHSFAATAVKTSITWPSHAAILTCAPPAKNGIYFNSFLINGKRTFAGEVDFQSETLFHAARRQGKRVLAVRYPHIDRKGINRQVDYGVFNGSDQSFSSNHVLSSLKKPTNWRGLKNDVKYYEITLNDRRLRRVAKVFKKILVEVSGSEIAVVFDTDFDLSNGVQARMTTARVGPNFLTFVAPVDSGWQKQRVTARFLNYDKKSFDLLIESSMNETSNAQIDKTLAENDLVSAPFFGLRGFGTNDRFFEFSDVVGKMIAERDIYTSQVTRVLWQKFKPDVTFSYIQSIDFYGHIYEGALKLPFLDNLTHKVNKAYLEVFESADRNLSQILSLADLDNDVIVVNGDHGMAPVRHVINLRKAVSDTYGSRFKYLTNASKVLVYNNNSEDDQATGARAFAAVAKNLSKIRVNNEPVIDQIELYRKEDAHNWDYGAAIAALTPEVGFHLEYSFAKSLRSEPTAPLGSHGYAPEKSEMKTAAFFYKKGLKPTPLGQMSLIDVVPTFAYLYGVRPPDGCKGSSLLGSK